MAQITINEISDNYTFNTGNGAFATVALPITAAWGPAYGDSTDMFDTDTLVNKLEDTKWLHFPATQEGLESFVATYRGPVSNFKVANDYSYQIAMTYLTAGYDVLTCRVCPGAKATGSVAFSAGTLGLTAKYPGTFGNNLSIQVTRLSYKIGETTYYYYNAIVYISDPNNGAYTAVENLVFTFGYNDAEIPTLDEIKSNFIDFTNSGVTDGATVTPTAAVKLSGGTDLHSAFTAVSDKYYAPIALKPTSWTSIYKFNGSAYAAATESDWGTTAVYNQCNTNAIALATAAKNLAELRYKGRYKLVTTSAVYDYREGAGWTSDESPAYLTALDNLTSATDTTKLTAIYNMEWVYTASFMVIQLLKDKLNYNPNRLMVPWDDQNLSAVSDDSQFSSSAVVIVSPLHKIIMDTAFASRCATGMVDLPKSLPRSRVYNTTTDGYVQMLSKETLPEGETSNNLPLYNTNSAVFGPWASYRLVSMQKMVSVPPSFLALLIHRAQVLNQAAQYEWILPTNRKHNLKIGEPDYTVSTKLLNIWQKLDGVGVNVIAKIPDLGTNVWGNSTLFDVPPATYQALANLSTRWLFNAIEDVVYKCGIAITFNYNNSQSYSKFYAGVSPILDTMINVGAIEDYKIRMSADINGLDQVNANSVIGKIWITPVGSISDITVDLIALPQGTSLAAFGE